MTNQFLETTLFLHTVNLFPTINKFTMYSDRDTFFHSIETENNRLTIHVSNVEAENFRLIQKVADLEKALEKQKHFHRKYAEDVVISESIRHQDFKNEKLSLVEQNKSQVQTIRQLTKDLSFYKKAFEELVKEDETDSTCSNKRTTRTSASSSSPPARLSTSALKSIPSRFTSAVTSSQKNSSECNHKSSKVLTKIADGLLMENKKLKVNANSLNATIRILKTKNQKLENLKKKIDNKKLKFSQDADELEKLVNSTGKKNKTTFTPEILVKLGELSKYNADCN